MDNKQSIQTLYVLIDDCKCTLGNKSSTSINKIGNTIYKTRPKYNDKVKLKKEYFKNIRNEISRYTQDLNNVVIYATEDIPEEIRSFITPDLKCNIKTIRIPNSFTTTDEPIGETIKKIDGILFLLEQRKRENKNKIRDLFNSQREIKN